MKIATTYPSEKLAYGVVGDAIVIISIIKGATGVIKQSGEWVVVGKDIAIGGVKKVFTKPDTPHHKTYIDTGGHNVDGDSHLGGSANEFTNTNAQFSKKGAWGHWSDYEKVAINGKEYAKIGDWLYTRHAVENLYPSKMGRAPGHTSNHDHLNLPPKFVNDIISNKNSKFAEVKKDGATRRIYDANDIRIITEGKVVITIYKNKINK